VHQSGITKKLPIQTGLDHLFNGLNNAATQRCLAPRIMPLDSRDSLGALHEKHRENPVNTFSCQIKCFLDI
jgi:hypothetical protein